MHQNDREGNQVLNQTKNDTVSQIASLRLLNSKINIWFVIEKLLN